uniref:Uncharacterized protein n=1 Tax=Timema tahoe TaxID=61484 RepID=A0A7R9FJ58_9NEOP|nr:unnamed protein product [Timema tahoe]
MLFIGDLAAVSEVLVQLSKRQGSTDNISVIVVFLTDPERIASRVLDDPALWERLKNGSAQDMADQNNGIDDPKSGLMLDLDIPASFKQNGTTTVQRSQLRDFDEPAVKPRGETPTPPADTGGRSLPQFRRSSVHTYAIFGIRRRTALKSSLMCTSLLPLCGTRFVTRYEQQGARDLLLWVRVIGSAGVSCSWGVQTLWGLGVGGIVCVGGEVENVGDSGEDSEDEWNYYKVEPSGEAVQDISKTSTHTVGSQPSTAEEDMESQLNPNAAEFVPSPTLTMPSMEEVLLSESPCKTDAPRDVSDPSSQREFTCEARTRPGELFNVESNFILHSTENSSVSSAKTNLSNPFSVSDSELKFQEKISFPESSFYSATENSSKEIDLSKDDFNEILKVDETKFQDNLALSNLPSVKSNFHTFEPDSFETIPFKAPVEPIHVSFELQKELAPEMERSPERVHLDSEETAVFQEFDKIVSSSHIEEDNIEQDLEIEPIVSSSHIQKDNIEQEIEPPISVLHELSPIPETSVVTDCNTSHQSENVSPVNVWDQTLSPVEKSLILGVTSLDPITTSPLPGASATESQSSVQDLKLVSFNLEPSMKVEVQSSLDTCLSSQQTDVDLITSPLSVNVSMDMFDINSPSEGGEGDMPDVLDPSHPQEPLHTVEQEEAINLTSPQDQCTYPLVQDQLLAERKDEEIPVLLDLSPSAPPRESDQPNVITNLNLVDIVEQLGENIVESDVIPASNSVLGTLNFEPSLLNTLENKASVEEQELLKSPDYEKLIEEEASPQEIAPELLDVVSTPDRVIKEELVLLSQVDPDKQIEAVEKLAGESAVDKAPATEDTLAIKTAVAGIVTASAAGAALALDKPTSEEKKNVSKKPVLGKDKKPGFGDKAKSAPMRSSKNTTITTTLAPVKSTPASPTKPLTSPVVKKQTGSLVTSRVGKTSPVTTSVPIKSKLSSNKPSTLLSKTTVGSSKPRPLSASPTKPTSTEKKPSLTNGEAVKPMVTKVPAPVAAKRLVSTTTKTATTKALSSTISKTSVTTSARQTTTTNSRTSTVSSPTARPKTAPVNGVPSKPRVPVSTVAFRAKQPVTNKQVKETANKQISSARTSSLTTTATKAPISANRTTTTTLRRLPGGVSKTTTSVKETSVGQKLILGPDKTGLDSKEVVTVEHTTTETKVDPTPPAVTTESIIQPTDQD